jgi:hypothetical protein
MKHPRFVPLTLAFLVALPLLVTQARCNESSDKLKAKTAEQPQDEAGAGLAQKRALLFLMLGNKEQAASELRKVVAYQEARYDAFVKHPPCCSVEEFVAVRSNVAEARIRLAHVMNDWQTLATELPVVIHGYEKRIAAADKLLAARAIEVNEAGAIVSDYRGRIAQWKSLLELVKKKTAPDGK